MNNGHGAAGTAGSQLFAKRAMFAGGNGGVIQAGRVDSDLVPAMHYIACGLWISVRGG